MKYLILVIILPVFIGCVSTINPNVKYAQTFNNMNENEAVQTLSSKFINSDTNCVQVLVNDGLGSLIPQPIAFSFTQQAITLHIKKTGVNKVLMFSDLKRVEINGPIIPGGTSGYLRTNYTCTCQGSPDAVFLYFGFMKPNFFVCITKSNMEAFIVAVAKLAPQAKIQSEWDSGM